MSPYYNAEVLRLARVVCFLMPLASSWTAYGQTGSASAFFTPELNYAPNAGYKNAVTFTIKPATSGPVPTGSLTCRFNGGAATTVALTPGTGAAKFVWEPFLPGQHWIDMAYSGDSHYAPFATKFGFGLPTPQFSGGDTYAFAETPFTTPVYIRDAAASQGTVYMIERGITAGSGPLRLDGNGSVQVQMNSLLAGDHLFITRFAGNVTIPDGTYSIKIYPKPALSLASAPVPSCTVGSSVFYDIRLTDKSVNAQGTMTVLDAGVVVASSILLGTTYTARFGYSCAQPGAHTLIVRLIKQIKPGFPPYTVDDLHIPLTVNKPTLSRGSGSLQGAYGQSLPIQVLMLDGPPGVNGTVSLYEGSSLVAQSPIVPNAPASGYRSTVDVVGLSAGTHQLIARFAGNVPIDDLPLSVTITRAGTSTRLQTNPGTDELIATVGFPSTPGTGSVRLEENGTLLARRPLSGSATATFSILAIPPGSHSFIATYEGDSNYLVSQSAPLAFTIAPRPAFTVHNSASGFPGVSPGALASAFGSNLATGVAQASAAPVTDLGGVKLTLADASGIRHPVPLFFVSPTQLNFLVPAEATIGAATLTLAGTTGNSSTSFPILPSAPGLYAANGAGSGPPAGFLVVGRGDGTQTTTPVFQCAESCKPVPLNLGGDSDVPVLVLYGTGFARSAELKIHIGALELMPDYAGPQGAFPGLDQVNVRLPATLRNSGLQSIFLIVGGARSNSLEVEF